MGKALNLGCFLIGTDTTAKPITKKTMVSSGRKEHEFWGKDLWLSKHSSTNMAPLLNWPFTPVIDCVVDLF